MQYINEFVDERQKSWCIQCGAWLADVETSNDHVPSKALLLEPYPENLPIVEICIKCNNGFSADEEYLFLFLSCVLAGSTETGHQPNHKARRALRRQWKLRSRIEGSKTEYRTVGGEQRCGWRPETERIDRVIVKNARGHAFYECGEPMLTEPAHVWTAPLEAMTAIERSRFEGLNSAREMAPWPEVGSRMLTRAITQQDLRDSWIMVQDGVYRYHVSQLGSLLVRSVLYEYLATEVYWGDC